MKFGELKRNRKNSCFGWSSGASFSTVVGHQKSSVASSQSAIRVSKLIALIWVEWFGFVVIRRILLGWIPSFGVPKILRVQRNSDAIRGDLITEDPQEAQLPQRNSASAAHMEGARPSSPLPRSPLWLHLCVRSNTKPATNLRQTCRPLSALKVNRAFKVIQGHPYWCQQEYRTVCCRNVQLMPKRTRIMTTGKRQIRRFQRPHSRLKTSQQETPSNIYKWFILSETRVIGLHFCRW